MSRPGLARRRPLAALIAAYGVAGTVWLVVARLVAPRVIGAAYRGRSLPALNRFFQGRTPHPLGHYLGLWEAFSGAVVLGGLLHLILILVVENFDRRSATEDPGDGRASRRASFVLILFGLAFLGLTILSGPRHDYVADLEIWGVVLRGGDPWWVTPERGHPLNAYGPLFNALAVVDRINPLAPKLLFAFSYLLFVVWLVKGCHPRPDGRSEAQPEHWPMPGLTGTDLAALVLNPLPWVEIAYFGHFDVVIGVLGVAAVHAVVRGRDASSGWWLGLGVLLKYYPLALLPFLAVHGWRVRVRLVLASLATIAVGMSASVWLWGPATFRPIGFAASRGANLLSVFRFLRGRWSPLRLVTDSPPKVETLAMPCLLLAGLLVFVWCWRRRVAPPTSAVMALLTTLLFYQVGFVQYQIVLLLLVAYESRTPWGHARLANDRFLSLALAAYFGWLAVFDLFYAGIGGVVHPRGRWGWVDDVVGLPTFLLGSLLLAALLRATAVRLPESPDGLGR